MSEAGGREEDDAARAFEALREEVASLRRGMELLYRQGQEARAEAKSAVEANTASSGATGRGVDYSLTLGEMAKSLQAMQARLTTIEGKPALEMTPKGNPPIFSRALNENSGSCF